MNNIYWSNLIKSSVINLVMVFLIALAVSYLFGTNYDRTTPFWLTVVFFVLAPLPIWLKNAAVAAVAGYLSKKGMVKRFLIEFRKADLPRREEYSYWDVQEYLGEVARSRVEQPDVRVKAAETLAWLAAQPKKSLISTLFISSAMQEAMADYYVEGEITEIPNAELADD